MIFKATRQHARNLATFALIYKGCMLFLRHLPLLPASSSSTSSTLGSSTTTTLIKEGPLDTFLAGLVGGYFVFGRGMQSSVNQQIVIYVFARVTLALAKLLVRRANVLGTGPQGLALRAHVERNAWPTFAALSWALVMWLYRWYPELLQPSLRSSMRYMYVFAFGFLLFAGSLLILFLGGERGGERLACGIASLAPLLYLCMTYTPDMEMNPRKRDEILPC